MRNVKIDADAMGGSSGAAVDRVLTHRYAASGSALPRASLQSSTASTASPTAAAIALPRLTRRVRRELRGARIADPDLQNCYRYARALNARHGKTYFVAASLLPPQKRPFVHALYGFARYADNIVDDLDSMSHPERRAERFLAWSSRCVEDFESGISPDPIVRAVLDTSSRWNIPAGYFKDFLTSMAMDLEIREYATFSDLSRYMWGSAAVIGLQMLPILGSVDAQPEASSAARRNAINLGIAFQLTNFLRDVSEDLERDRIYIPQDSLESFGVDRDRLLHARATGTIDNRIRQLLAHEIDRTRSFYRNAAPGIDLVDPTSRHCLRTAYTLYSEILTEIEKQDYNVFSRRATVSFARRCRVAGIGLLRNRASSWHHRPGRDR